MVPAQIVYGQAQIVYGQAETVHGPAQIVDGQGGVVSGFGDSLNPAIPKTLIFNDSYTKKTAFWGSNKNSCEHLNV